MNKSVEKAVFWATGCGIGNVRRAPGTFGTLLGIPLAFIISILPGPLNFALLLGLIVFSVVVSERASTIMGKKDPGSIVIDEIAGFCVAVFGLPFNFSTVAAGFVLFRFLDILKPWPVRYFDRNFSGGTGITADDVMAGLMALPALHLLHYLDII